MLLQEPQHVEQKTFTSFDDFGEILEEAEMHLNILRILIKKTRIITHAMAARTQFMVVNFIR